MKSKANFYPLFLKVLKPVISPIHDVNIRKHTFQPSPVCFFSAIPAAPLFFGMTDNYPHIYADSISSLSILQTQSEHLRFVRQISNGFLRFCLTATAQAEKERGVQWRSLQISFTQDLISTLHQTEFPKWIDSVDLKIVHLATKLQAAIGFVWHVLSKTYLGCPLCIWFVYV